MSLKKRIPMVSLQKALYGLLRSYPSTLTKSSGEVIEVPIFDNVPGYKLDEAGNMQLDGDGNPLPVTPPYAVFGSFTCKPIGTKDIPMYAISQQLMIYSASLGKSEVNEIADDISSVISLREIAGVRTLNLSADRFEVIEQDTDFFEAYPEEEGNGYWGVLTFVAKIQDLGGA